MHIQFVRHERGRLRFGLLYGPIVLCMLAAAHILPLGELLPACIFHNMTGIACPTCGTTRALLFLARGELIPALSLNPCMALLMLALLAWMVMDLVFLCFRTRVPVLRTGRTGGIVLRIAAGLIFLGNWAYLVLRHI